MPPAAKDTCQYLPDNNCRAANLADVGIGPAPWPPPARRQTRSRRRCGGRSTSAAQRRREPLRSTNTSQSNLPVTSNRQVRSLDLDMRIAVAASGHRATENVRPSTNWDCASWFRPVASSVWSGLASSRKNHRPEVTPDADVVFDNVPFALVMDGVHLDWAVVIDRAKPRQQAEWSNSRANPYLSSGSLLDQPRRVARRR